MATTTLVPQTHSRRHKKGRKFGRKGRRPGHARYNLEKRWLTNKARRVRKCNGEVAHEAFCKLNGLSS